MAQVTREDFLKKITETVTDSELKISLLEDFDDSFDVKGSGAGETPDYESDANPYKKQHTELSAKYSDLEKRYTQRFLDGKPSGSGSNSEKVTGETPDGREPVSYDSLFEEVERK